MAHPAYIDPGSGSFVVQIVIAALLGASVTIKAYWRRIKAFFSPASRAKDDSSNEG